MQYLTAELSKKVFFSLVFCEAGRLCPILETEFWPVLHLGIETTGCLGCSDVTRTQPVEK